MTTTLLVKGSTGDAAAAAAEHSITMAYIGLSADAECTLWETNAPYEKVAGWFNAPPRSAPFPVGTLLHFSLGG